MDETPPQPPPSSLAGLPSAALHEILARVPCSFDRGRVPLVSRAWRRAIAHFPPPAPPHPLPWLLLPSPSADADVSTRVVCVLSGCRRVHHYLTVHPRGARCFGSHDGAWLFLAFRQWRGHELVNVRTRRVHVLPRALQFRNDPRLYGIAILAAALSHPPDDPRCVAAGIVAYWLDPDADPTVPPLRCHFALWRMGARVVFDIAPPTTEAALDVEDVVYHDQAFHFVTQGDHIRVGRPILYQNGGLGAAWELRRFQPGGRTYEQYVYARYLVVSRGELLMVVRFRPHPGQQAQTSAFKVFRVIAPQLPDYNLPAAVEYPWSWSELHTLGGRILFVGRGCSRSYETNQYPGFKDGVYFMDDGDDMMIFRDANERQYPCSDNGMWSAGPPRRAHRCFPAQGPSDYSSPAWLLPRGDRFLATL
ncbi:uncharacterized protein LOC133900231 [Phragmites australis]|uniref:uncharacterized protein LOC133900231 n=1 Tax=Phragmites australis TaxID=29695 RepID=UPI002D796A90|nr:uncharacterized protein LOC133900231 [Phragmites australis]